MHVVAMDFSLDSLDLDNNDDFFEISDECESASRTSKDKTRRVDLLGSKNGKEEREFGSADGDCPPGAKQTPRGRVDLAEHEALPRSRLTEIDAIVKATFHDQEGRCPPMKRKSIQELINSPTHSHNSTSVNMSSISKHTTGQNTSTPDSSCMVNDEERETPRQSSLNKYDNLTPNCASRTATGKSRHMSTPTTPPNTTCRVRGEECSAGKSLSPWERWVIQKAHKEREKREKMKQSKVVQHEQDVEKMARERDKKESAQKIYDEWVKKKEAIERERKRKDKQILTEKTAQEKEKRQQLNSMANSRFNEWRSTKREEMKRKEKQKLEEHHQWELKHCEQKAKAEEAYRRWLIAAGRRRIDSEYCAGRKDSPSYSNPNTWKGPLDNS